MMAAMDPSKGKVVHYCEEGQDKCTACHTYTGECWKYPNPNTASTETPTQIAGMTKGGGGGGGGGGSKAACVTTATRMEPDGGCYQAGADGNAEPPTMTAGNGYEQYTEGARGRALMSAKRTLTQAAPVHQVA